MNATTILVVEDNPITRKMLRLTLESEGYSVVDAGDGREALAIAAGRCPDLAVLDFVLPDIDGLALLAELRRRCAAPELPALLVTGMVSRLEQLRAEGGPFVEVLAKPIEPGHLIQAVRGHLALPEGRGGGRSILVIDDEPMNLKLAAVHLRLAGYEVETAGGALEGLEKARHQPPAAILADVLMPGMDGFELCLVARRDPLLAAIPVLLSSAAYVDEADRELARTVGARALVLRGGDLREAIEALAMTLRSPGAQPMPVLGDQVATLHRERLQVQLERERSRNESLLRQAAIQATALSVIRGLSHALSEPTNAPKAMGDVLVHCLDAAGLSTGFLYLARPDGEPVLEAQFGLPADKREGAESCFGRQDLVRRIMVACEPVAFSESAEATPDGGDFLHRLGLAAVLFIPFVVLGRSFGVLVLASDSHDLGDSAWIGFARSLAAQFGQTVALGQSLERLAASESRHRALMEQAYDAILILDLQPRILEANREAERLLGRPRAELVGRSYHDFVVDEERAESVRRHRSLLDEGGVRVGNRNLLRADGARIPVDVSASLVHVGDPSGEPIILAILRDVSERRRLEAELLHAQKMESLGRLAGGVAHDFNNMLAVMTGYAELLRELVAGDEQMQGYADEILTAGERAAGLTRQLLAFSRRQVLQPRILDLNRVVREVETMLRRVIGEDVELVTTLEERVPAILADPGQLEQVLLNLAVNARDAMPRGGRLALATSAVEVGEADIAAVRGLPAGRYVMLAVSDTGEGMSPQVLSQIFEPFFTTKEMGKGTGLGLATVLGIVEQSGGQILVDSMPGRGSTFEVYLPVVEAAPALVPRPGQVEIPRGSETVLVVEDEAAVRELVRRFLGASGYTVLEAAEGTAALALAAAHQGPIHLLLTDVVLPGSMGTEVALRLVAQRPATKVLYMSGYADDAPLAAGALLAKPFTAASLARKVREVLGS